jgi:lipoate-protein ligase B
MQPVTHNPHPTTRNAQPCYYLELPLTDYHEAWKLQLALVKAKNCGILKADVILLLEHPAVYTLGRRGGIENLTVSKAVLEKSNIQVVPVERGGNITYHGPGQLVVYPIIDLNRTRLGITDLVSGMEDIMIRTAEDFGIHAGRNQKNRGVWIGNHKLGSIGIAVRKGISFHGFALNVNPGLTPFEWIHPCGLTDIRMTSFKKELGVEPSMGAVRKAILQHMENIFHLKLERITKITLNDLLSINPSAKASVFSGPGKHVHVKKQTTKTPLA